MVHPERTNAGWLVPAGLLTLSAVPFIAGIVHLTELGLVSLANAVLALILGLWLWALLRARGGAIPCMPRVGSLAVVAIGGAALVGIVGANVLALEALGQLGPGLDPFAFAVWLGAMSAAGILFIMDIAALRVNREALVSIRIVEPDALIVREPGAETRIELGPGSVLAFIVGNGLSGPSYVQYHVKHGERRLNLVVPFTMSAAGATGDAPWLEVATGPIAQAGARRLNRFLAPFCMKHPGAAA
ncbi:MAG: hypothetical protein QM820_26835 [Minicystis sp.]